MLDNMAVKNRVYGLIELDVTKAREYMHNYKERTGESLSFTARALSARKQKTNWRFKNE